MGVDKSLTDDYPSIIINGTRYHYGRELKYGQYLVENANYAKDYWCFNRKEDLLAFLVNLPETADRYRRMKLYPDWYEVTHEQREAYGEEDLARLRELMAEKQKAGTARHYPMYPEDDRGPFRDQEPLRIEADSKLPPVERVEEKLREYKERHRPPPGDLSLPAGTAGNFIDRFLDHSWESGLSETGKLYVLEKFDWSGVSDHDKEAILRREVDFTCITKDRIEWVFGEIEFETEGRVRPDLALRIWEMENLAPQVEPDLEPEF